MTIQPPETGSKNYRYNTAAHFADQSPIYSEFDAVRSNNESIAEQLADAAKVSYSNQLR